MTSKRKRSMIWVVVGIVAALVLLSSTIAYYYTEVLWFAELGYLSVFLTRLWARVALGVGAALILGTLLWINLRIAKPSVMEVSGQIEEREIQALFRPKTLGRIFLGVSVIFGLFAGLVFSGEWETILRFIHQTPFGVSDPIFNQEVAFYVFTLPVYQLVYNALSFVLVFLFLGMALIYFASGSINVFGGRLNIHPRARFHLGGLLTGFFLLRGFGYWLQTFNLLYSTRGVAFGASYTDIFAQLPALRILLVLSLLAALATIWFMRSRDLRWIYAAVILMVVGSIGLGGAYPAVIQRLVVDPNEIARERPYIEHNIEFTRAAFGLDEVKQQEFPAQETLTWEDLDRNMLTIDNLRIWDWRPIISSYQQLESIRAYYSFQDVDVDRYMINDEYRQVLLAAREIDHSEIPGAQTWVNQRLQYTHGYGVVMSPASRVTEEGLPQMWIQGIPPQSDIDLEIENPAIYYGEITDDYVIANSLEPELHYPEGDQGVYIHYDGDGGVPLEGIGRRVAFALRFGDYNIVLSGALQPESRMMYHRNIRQRVRHLAPFLAFDGDPYVVIHEGRLVWIQDAYTATSRYPYSEPYQDGVNYIRNSVKVVTCAYSGDVDFYVFDPDDPMIRAYMAIFPDLFKSEEEMPENLKRHVRYPLDLFEVQMNMFRTYHMQDPVVFYNKEDLWEVSDEIFAGGSQRMEPYYILMELPGEDAGLEYLLMIPYTPSGREVMVSWMVGRSDYENYGELFVFNMPKGRTVFGPRQIEARIDQDSEMSQLFSLWGRAGSRVLRGSMLVVPIEDSILYVEPIYLEAEGAEIPELRRVVVAYGNRLAIGLNLEESIRMLFGMRPDDERDPTEPGVPIGEIELVEQANSLYRRAQEAIRIGDWSRYGQLMEELGEVLEELHESIAPPEE